MCSARAEPRTQLLRFGLGELAAVFGVRSGGGVEPESRREEVFDGDQSPALRVLDRAGQVARLTAPADGRAADAARRSGLALVQHGTRAHGPILPRGGAPAAPPRRGARGAAGGGPGSQGDDDGQAGREEGRYAHDCAQGHGEGGVTVDEVADGAQEHQDDEGGEEDDEGQEVGHDGRFLPSGEERGCASPPGWVGRTVDRTATGALMLTPVRRATVPATDQASPEDRRVSSSTMRPCRPSSASPVRPPLVLALFMGWKPEKNVSPDF